MVNATAPLMVRVPEAARDRLEEAASARGETVQSLVGLLVDQFLAAQERTPPTLDRVISILQSHEAELRARGISGLWIFGSVARGDAGDESDVDLLAEFDPAREPSLVGLASIRADLSDLLGVAADLVPRPSLHSAVRQAADAEAIRVL